jgi:hypothetical protein
MIQDHIVNETEGCGTVKILINIQYVIKFNQRILVTIDKYLTTF